MSLVVAIRISLASLPKGGGEAVTGGFFFFCAHGRAHGPCPTRCCVIGPRADRVVRPYKEFRRGRCLHRPAPPYSLQHPAPTHRKSAGPSGPALPISEYKKPRRVCRPQAAKNWDHFSPRHARGEKSLSGCQCGILPPCDKIMRAAACNPLGGKFRRNFRQFSPVI